MKFLHNRSLCRFYLIALVLTIILGWAVVNHVSQRRAVIRSPYPVVEPDMPISGSSGLVALIIDSATYAALSVEVDQYAADVRHDLGADVQVLSEDWLSPQAVREGLRALRGQGLVGAVLVGQVPTTYFYAQLAGPQLDKVPSDFYYMELERDLALGEDQVFEPPAASASLLPDIWVGRLKPAKEGQAGLEQLRQYFRRNHDFRTGHLRYVPQMLVVDDITASVDPLDGASASTVDVSELGPNSGLYPAKNVILPSAMRRSDRSATDLGRMLRTSYELAYLVHHGSPTTQEFGGAILTGNEIEGLAPQPLFYMIWSCSNGDFTSQEYLAGAYLFGGRGLAVLAPTVPVFGNIESGLPLLWPLSLGATLGESYRYRGYLTPIALLGDPTLRLRRPPSRAPRIVLQPTEVDFGTVAPTAADGEAMPLGAQTGGPGVVIRVTNTGTAPLVFSRVPSIAHVFYNDEWATGATATPVSFSTPSEIPPGASDSLVFSFTPTQPGQYAGFIGLYTNDPQAILVTIPFRGTGQGD